MLGRSPTSECMSGSLTNTDWSKLIVGDKDAVYETLIMFRIT